MSCRIYKQSPELHLSTSQFQWVSRPSGISSRAEPFASDLNPTNDADFRKNT